MSAVFSTDNGGTLNNIGQVSPDLASVTCKCGWCKSCVDELLSEPPALAAPDAMAADDVDEYDYCDCPFCAGWDYYQWTLRRPPEWLLRQNRLEAMGLDDLALYDSEESEERRLTVEKRERERERRQDRRKRRNQSQSQEQPQ